MKQYKILNINSIKQKKIIDRFFLFIGILGLVLTSILSFLYTEAKGHNEIALKVLKIRSLNTDIDSELLDEFSIAKTDLINKNMQQINYLLQEIEKSDEYNKILVYSDANEALDALKVAFEAKKGTINEYLTNKAIISETMLDLSSNLRYTTEIRTLAGFYARILLGRFGDIFDPSLFADDVAKKRLDIIKENKNASIDYDYLTKLGKLNERLMLLSEINERTKQVNIDKKAQSLLESLKTFNDKLGLMANGISILFFGIISLFILRLFFENSLFKRMLRKSQQIDYVLKNSDDTLLTLDDKGTITQIQGKKVNNSNPIGNKLEIYKEDGVKINIIDDIKESYGKNEILSYDFTSRVSTKKHLVYEKLFARGFFDKFGNLTGAEIFLHDFSDEYLAKFKLEHISKELEHNYTTDKETGLPNHLALSEALKSNQRAYLIYISIEQFENIQFFYNEKTVLLILIEVSRALNLALENFKIPAILHRLQEDKFCLFYYGDKHPKKMVDQILNYFSSTITMPDDKNHDITLNVNLCIGVSLDIDTQNTDRLTQARLAHQSAKEHEESIFYYEQNDENERAYRQNQIISRLIRNALNGGGVTVECQPLFDLNKPIDKSYEIFSYEILVRILDDQGKMRYPGEFLGVAKHAGLYLSITKAVIMKAFELAERYDYRFSVNLSSTDMTNSGIIELFKSGLEKCRNPEHITIEVLETESVEQDLNEVRAFLDMVRSKGCHVAIDDFGSGYANIAIILQLDIDYIKIDGSVVQRLPFDPDSREFLRMLANFANVTGYTMVAEFVSNQEILDQVKALGVQYAQGYLLGKPISLM